jgi:HAD superfamily hydrolase (TIGR01509 family)
MTHKPTRRPAALIFDCDGTLVDTMPAHFHAWQAALAPHGLSLPAERFYALGGVPSEKIIKMLADEAGIRVDAEALAHRKEDLFEPMIEAVGPVEPVVDVARRAYGKLPMAVATGAMRRIAQRALDRIGIRRWFATLVASEDTELHKPHPHVYLEAAFRLGVPPQRCRAYEDTDLGLQSARAAGMDAVDIRQMLR